MLFTNHLQRIGLAVGSLILLTSCSTSTQEQAGSTNEANSNIAPSLSKAAAREYIFNDSDTILLTDHNLSNIDSRMMELARNEIFARHGYIFKRKDLAGYFASKPWYQQNQNYTEDFTDTEKKNIALIRSYEAKYAAYQLTPSHYDYHLEGYKGSSAFKQQTMSIDLNGDGNNDNVELELPDQESDTTWKLHVNDSVIAFDGLDRLPYFEVVDLDINDPYFEIAFQSDSQFDFFRQTDFYYYDGQTIQSVGTVPDFAAHSSRFDGNGRVKGAERAKEFQTWYREPVFRLDADHQLYEEKQDFYPMSPPTVVTAKRELTLQQQRNLDTNLLHILPGDQVSFLGEDDNGYIKFELSSGVTGWYHAAGAAGFSDYFDGLILSD